MTLVNCLHYARVIWVRFADSCQKQQLRWQCNNYVQILMKEKVSGGKIWGWKLWGFGSPVSAPDNPYNTVKVVYFEDIFFKIFPIIELLYIFKTIFRDCGSRSIDVKTRNFDSHLRRLSSVVEVVQQVEEEDLLEDRNVWF